MMDLRVTALETTCENADLFHLCGHVIEHLLICPCQCPDSIWVDFSPLQVCDENTEHTASKTIQECYLFL